MQSFRSFIFPLILLVGVALRCLWLGRESLWIDEYATWWCANGDLARAWRAETNNPPLYYALMYFWSGWFGTSEAALRAFSVIPSCGSLVLTYQLGRRLFSWSIACMATAFLAVGTFPLSYAQEARVHAWLSFLILAATAIYFRLITREENRGRWWCVYAALAAVCFYLHYISPVFFGTHGLFTAWLVLRREQPARRLVEHAAAGAAAAVAFIPQLLQFASGQAGAINRSRDLIYLKLPQAYFSFLFGDYLIPLDQGATLSIRATLRQYAPHLVTAVCCSLVLAPFVAQAWRRWNGRTARLGFAMTIVPVLLCFLVSFKVSVFDERYMLSVEPFVALAVAAGIQQILDRPAGLARWLGLAAVAAWGGLLLVALSHFYFDPRFHRERWRDAVATLEREADPARDRILLDPDYMHLPVMYYGRRAVPFDRMLEGRREALLNGDPGLLGQLRGLRRIWLLRSHYENDQVLNALRRSFTEKRYLHFDQGKRIEVYEFAP